MHESIAVFRAFAAIITRC